MEHAKQIEQIVFYGLIVLMVIIVLIYFISEFFICHHGWKEVDRGWLECGGKKLSSYKTYECVHCKKIKKVEY